jgi:DNA-binding Lrp family transcriptional regulator
MAPTKGADPASCDDRSEARIVVPAGERDKQSSKPTTQKVNWRDVLPVHPAAEMFDPLSPEELKALGEDIKKNGVRAPIALWKEQKHFPPKVLDGCNRLDSIEVNGGEVHVDSTGNDCDPHVYLSYRFLSGEWRPLETVVLRGDKPGGDPHAYVMSANVRRRHLTVDDKDRLIVQLLKADPNKSNRQVAKIVDASHPHVAKVRQRAEKSGDVETVTTSIDTKGRQQPARKPKGHALPANGKADCEICGGTGERARHGLAEACGQPIVLPDGKPFEIGPYPCPQCRPTAARRAGITVSTNKRRTEDDFKADIAAKRVPSQPPADVAMPEVADQRAAIDWADLLLPHKGDGPPVTAKTINNFHREIISVVGEITGRLGDWLNADPVLDDDGRGTLLNAVDLAITDLRDLFKRIENIATSPPAAIEELAQRGTKS